MCCCSVMTPKTKNRAVLFAALVTIFCLVALIVYIWTGYKSSGPTIASPLPQSTRGPLKVPPSDQAVKVKHANVSTLFPPTGIGPSPSSSELPSTMETPLPKKLNIGDGHQVEKVRPIKLPPILEEEELEPHGEEQPPRLRHKWHHHNGGHFRARDPNLWDPHPRYAFSAFGRRFRLDLTLDAPFLSPHLRVATYWRHQSGEHSDMSRETRPASAEHGKCFYSGTVNGDPASSVAVNLCHGMTGHIRTTEGSFFIEPIEAWEPQSPTTLHAIYRVNKPLHSEPVRQQPTSTCGLDDSLHNSGINYEKLMSTVEGAPVADHPMGSSEGHHVHTEKNERKIVDDEEEEVDDSEEDENGDRVIMEDQIGEQKLLRRRKRSASKEYFVEVMVVADRTMMEYHGDGLVNYVFTLMGIVSRIYKDASIGNPMTVAVVKLVQAEKDFVSSSSKRSPTDGTSAPEMLRNFCSWQHKMNDDDDSSPHHHDTAILLTRENICRNPSINKCHTLGLAELGTMCDQYSSCAIIQDNGLSSAFTIAHELGHVLNLFHDEDRKCERFFGGTPSRNVMSKMLDNETHPWSWSNCSRHFLTEFLELGRSQCLLDHPPQDTYQPMSNSVERLPGENFTEDRQCELVFGAGSKVCSYMPMCRRLWCTTDLGDEKEGCRTQHMPWADGTSCGLGKWCQKGSCVHQNRSILLPVDGGWEAWQSWGPCSRTCGGGVKKSERFCTAPTPANGGKYCVGLRVRFKACNKNECPPGSREFRELQCAEHNNHTPPGTRLLPKYSGIGPADQCKLYCQVHNSNEYFLLSDKVKDGTTCGLNTYDMCINGKCTAADCSHTIYPTKRLVVDICGKCGGDNTTCKMISGKYNESLYGYRKVVLIPAGSSNIDITQSSYRDSSKDDNYLALVDPSSGEYLLNGNFIVSMFRKLIPFGGATIEYTGSDMVVERINSSRPLDRDLVVEVLSVGVLNSPRIHYQYTVLHNKSSYRWQIRSEWTRCNHLCQGEKYRLPVCVRDTAGFVELVDDALCVGQQRPRKHVEHCNTQCTLRWKISRESPCSVRCGRGTKHLTIQCVREHHAGSGRIPVVNAIDESYCSHLTHKPHHLVPCEEPCHSASWQYSEWSPCSATCGDGEQKRRAICRGSDGQHLHRKFCGGIRNPKSHDMDERRRCRIQECPRWATGEWTPCSVKCGSGEQRRPYWCELEGKPVAEEYCRSRSGRHHDGIPIHIQPCNAGPCGYNPEKSNWIYGEQGPFPTAHPFISSSPLVSPTTAVALPRTPPPPPSSRWDHYDDQRDAYLPQPRTSPIFRWRAGLWGPCSESCREDDEQPTGKLRRLVVCQDEHGRDADALQCSRSKKPLDVIPCPQIPICPKWSYGDWGPCNVSCGEGRQFREVGCKGSEGQALAETKCPVNKRPENNRVCAAAKCPTWPKSRRREPKFVWKTWPWEKCSTTCGMGYQRRKVVCHRVSRPGSEYSEALETLQSSPGNPQYCQVHLKPTDQQRCHMSECPTQFRWKTGRWKPCTQPCGRKGKQRRMVTCVRMKPDGHFEPTAKHNCPRSTKPIIRQKCNRHPCEYSSCEMLREAKWRDYGMQNETRDGEYRLMVGGISVSIYCHGMTIPNAAPKEYLTLPTGERENYSEFYDRRLLKPNTCPHGGLRRDDCECTVDSNGKGGRTVFSRVRINVTSMRIDTEDMTFARQLHGARVAYGEAGDCYSSLDCPQGRFSINLKGTGLRIHSSVEWEGRGAGASVHISRRDDGQSILGRCGGYCGACYPAGTPWIALDVMPRNESGLR